MKQSLWAREQPLPNWVRMSGYPHKKVKRLSLLTVSLCQTFIRFIFQILRQFLSHTSLGKSKMQQDFVLIFRVFEVLVHSEKEIPFRRWEWCGKFLRILAVPILACFPNWFLAISYNSISILQDTNSLHHGSKCNYLRIDRDEFFISLL